MSGEIPFVYFKEKLLDFSWIDFPFDWEEFRQSEYCKRLVFWLKSVQVDSRLESFVHGLSHTERVALYGAVIAWKENAPIEKIDMLILACLYHDVGRNDDGRDWKHGEKSAVLLKGGEYARALECLSDTDLQMLCAIVELHSQCFRIFQVCRKYDSLSYEEIVYYSSILVDADVLDRVRLISKERLYFGTDTAKQMLDFRKEVFSKYMPPKSDSYFYHVTKKSNVKSILESGLKKPENGFVYFANTPEDCVQLAPCAGEVLATNVYINRFKCKRKMETLSYPMALLKVNLAGLEGMLVRRLTARAEELLRENKRVGIYEYLLTRSVPTERIIDVSEISIDFQIYPESRDYLCRILND